ncbi:NAD(P)/FAD-dependent oxidoreductase [Halomonas marinisediminis]|uniref:FAD-binding oxidoreductase n=1 Tax=Halomonas marinisediminis TaxID=2546095 RepID=A0ABY2D473_9GAMM|nr:FAD-binding oxidoreductase [Halomonas marinisediminis]TDB01186.1 FAD-binding oxidoreductase [Halomonas marinisediminis]
MIFPEYDNRCGWYELLGSVTDYPALEGNHNFETIVIGGGLTGAAAARRMAENCPQERVLLLEALKVGQGASGRNSGFAIYQPHKHELEMASQAHVQKLIGLNQAAIDYLETQVRTYGIDCQWSQVGKYQAAVSARGLKFLKHFESLLKRSGENYQRLENVELRDIIGTDFYKAAIYTPRGILLQPAALMRGLADHMPDNVTISEHSPVTSLERQAKGFRVETSTASITCDRILLATNAFTAEFGFMRNQILPVMTFASMSEPLDENQAGRFGGKFDWGITPADHAGTTVRMTQDRRLIIRNSHRYAHDYNTPTRMLPKIKENHLKAHLERYPQLDDLEYPYTWGGTSSLSGNFETFFGQLEEGIYSAGCDQCVGICRGTISGMMMADMAAGRESSLLEDIIKVSGSPTRLPPRPLLRIGVPLRMKMARWASRKEI